MDLDVDMDAGSLPLESGALGDPDRAPTTTTNTTAAAAAAAAAAKRANLGASSPSSLTFAEGGAPTFVVDDGDDAALNLPLGSRARDATNDSDLPVPTPCIVKMYGTEDADDVKLNDVLELVGVLAIAPNIAAEAEAAEADGWRTPPPPPPPPRGRIRRRRRRRGRPRRRHRRFHGGERAHNPPTSVVPRFHALVARRATPHGFATLPRRAERRVPASATHPRTSRARPSSSPRSSRTSPRRWAGTRSRRSTSLHAGVSRALADGRDALGKHGTTLLGAPEGGFVARALAAAIAQIAPCVAHLPLSISSLNARPWTPRKDYATNRLRSGPLQVAPGTALVLDEPRSPRDSSARLACVTSTR